MLTGWTLGMLTLLCWVVSMSFSRQRSKQTKDIIFGVSFLLLDFTYINFVFASFSLVITLLILFTVFFIACKIISKWQYYLTTDKWPQGWCLLFIFTIFLVFKYVHFCLSVCVCIHIQNTVLRSCLESVFLPCYYFSNLIQF